MKLKLVLVFTLLIALVGCSSAPPSPAVNAPTSVPAATTAPDATAEPTADAPAATTAPDATAEATANVAADASDDATQEASADTSQPSQPTSTQEPCLPGWAICKTLDDPKIIIRASRQVSQSAVDAVAHIYTDMTSRFNPAYPKDKVGRCAAAPSGCHPTTRPCYAHPRAALAVCRTTTGSTPASRDACYLAGR